MKGLYAADVIIYCQGFLASAPGYMSGIQQILCFGSRFNDFLRIVIGLCQVARNKSTPHDSSFHFKFRTLVLVELVIIVQRFFKSTQFNKTLTNVHDGGCIVGFQEVGMLIKIKRFSKLAK